MAKVYITYAKDQQYCYLQACRMFFQKYCAITQSSERGGTAEQFIQTEASASNDEDKIFHKSYILSDMLWRLEKGSTVVFHNRVFVRHQIQHKLCTL